MNPFSVFTYIKRNRARAASIILMLACTAIVFMGGMYIDNIGDVFNYAYEDPSQYAICFANGNNNDIKEEVNEFLNDQETLLPESAKTHINIDVVYADYKSIMGFNNGISVPIMLSKEDFETFIRLTDVLPKDLELEDGELVISEMLANNWGVKEGDVIRSDDESSHINLSADMTIKKILPLKGMQIYGWSDKMQIYGTMILPTTEEHADTLTKDLNDLRNTIREKYPHVEVYTNESIIQTGKDQIEILSYFFFIVLIVVAVVFAITLNATFAAMYDKRKYEFSIYKALGFSKGKLFTKVLGELLAMDLVGLLFGSVICFVVINILNETLWEQGLRFIRPSVMGIVGTIICNVAIIIPVVYSNMRRIRKYDVTVY